MYVKDVKKSFLMSLQIQGIKVVEIHSIELKNMKRRLKMVKLDKETIDAIQKIEKAVEKTSFEINSFDVSDTGIEGRTMIELDIRKKEIDENA